MHAMNLIADVRQRCGDVNAINPQAAELLGDIITTLASDTTRIYRAALDVRAAQKEYFATRTDAALKTAKDAEKNLDRLLLRVGTDLGLVRPPATQVTMAVE